MRSRWVLIASAGVFFACSETTGGRASHSAGGGESVMPEGGPDGDAPKADAADSAGDDADVPDRVDLESICNGSTDVRLLVVTAGGRGGPSFVLPWGQLLAIDGQCRYFVTRGFRDDLRSDHLRPFDANELGRGLGWGRLAAWADHEDPQCPDAPSTLITDGSAQARCRCGSVCGPEAPDGLADAVERAIDVREMLYESGTSWPADVTVAAQELSRDGVNGLPAWPLDIPLEPITAPSLELLEQVALHVAAGPEAEALRALRVAPTAVARTEGLPFASEAGQPRAVYIRDELPGFVAEAVERL